MQRRTCFSAEIHRRRKRRRNGTGGRRRLSDILPVIVFTVALSVYILTGLPDHEKPEDLSVFRSIASLTEQMKIFSGDGKGNTTPASDVKELSLTQLGEISDMKIRVLDEETKKVSEVPLEEYVACVTASEMPSDFETEALKAQAVAARTYAAARKKEYENGKCSHSDENAYVCNTVHCQVYRTEAELRDIKGDEWMEEEFPKILSAVYETAGEVLYYDGELVEQPLFFSSGGDRTENSEDVFVSTVPYLRSVESGIYESSSPHNNVKVAMTMEEFRAKVSEAYGAESGKSVTPETIRILSRTEGGAAESVQIGNLDLTGREVRSLLGLASADFEVTADENTVTFITSGSGHRVGLSQYGADGMAEQGKTYREILEYYYSGVEVDSLKS